MGLDNKLANVNYSVPTTYSYYFSSDVCYYDNSQMSQVF